MAGRPAQYRRRPQLRPRWPQLRSVRREANGPLSDSCLLHLLALALHLWHVRCCRRLLPSRRASPVGFKSLQSPGPGVHSSVRSPLRVRRASGARSPPSGQSSSDNRRATIRPPTRRLTARACYDHWRASSYMQPVGHLSRSWSFPTVPLISKWERLGEGSLPNHRSTLANRGLPSPPASPAVAGEGHSSGHRSPWLRS